MQVFFFGYFKILDEGMLLEGVNQNLVLLLVAQDLPENLVNVMHGVVISLA